MWPFTVRQSRLKVAVAVQGSYELVGGLALRSGCERESRARLGTVLRKVGSTIKQLLFQLKACTFMIRFCGPSFSEKIARPARDINMEVYELC
jgi:hypothetical protein